MKIETHLNHYDFNSIAGYLERFSAYGGDSSYDQRLARRYGQLFARIAEGEKEVLVIVEDGNEVTMRVKDHGT